MKAAIALIFFACIAGSMADNAIFQGVEQLVQQAQAVAQTVISQLKDQVIGLVQQAFGQIQSLVGASAGRAGLGGLGDALGQALNQVKEIAHALANNALSSVLGSLGGLLGGRGDVFNGIQQALGEFLQQMQGTITSIGQHVLNQGLSAVLGGLGSLGSRGIGDIFSGLSAQVSAAVAAAQGALSGAVGGLQALGGSLLDSAKPHWQQLQEQLVGHGLNVLGSLSETVNNLHGTITSGGR